MRNQGIIISLQQDIQRLVDENNSLREELAILKDKPKRKRRTKAEIEADNEQANS